MLIGLRLEEKIRSRAGEIWLTSWRAVPKWAVDPKSTWVYKLRSNPNVIKACRYFAWRVLPTIFLVVFAYIVAWAYHHVRISPKADIPSCSAKCLLLTQSVHWKVSARPLV
jgi:hypothetical protein